MKDYMLIMTATQTSGGGDVTIKTIEFNSMDGAEKAGAAWLQANQNIDFLECSYVCVNTSD